jgi:hypothetical protein
MMDKKAIAAILEEMGTLLELQGANPLSRVLFTTRRAPSIKSPMTWPS